VIAYKFVGCFDESEDKDVLCMAGFFAPAHHWPSFGGAWLRIVASVGMVEFHAADCENRTGFFETWDKPTERRAVEQRFLDLITKRADPSPVGFVVGIDLVAYARTLGPSLKSTLARGYHKAWLLAFVHALNRMVEAQRIANQTTRE